MLVGNPQASFVRPGNTTAYAAGQLIANATAAGSIVLPSISLYGGNFYQAAAIPRIRLWTSATTGWGSVVVRVRLWSAQPVYAGGDGAAYSVVSGSLNSIGYGGYDVTLNQLGDGAIGAAAGNIGTAHYAAVPALFFDLMLQTGAPVPASGQQFTVIPELAG